MLCTEVPQFRTHLLCCIIFLLFLLTYIKSSDCTREFCELAASCSSEGLSKPAFCSFQELCSCRLYSSNLLFSLKKQCRKAHFHENWTGALRNPLKTHTNFQSILEFNINMISVSKHVSKQDIQTHYLLESLYEPACTGNQ